jgi:Zn-finger nucleic acid-binding protein
MICPVCKSDMIVVEQSNIELDYCTACRGVWFDSGELELLLESSGLEDLSPFLGTVLNAAEASSSEKKRKCPICRRNMKKVFIDEGGKILVDICHDGHGIWFDGGEVGHLLMSLAEKSPGKACFQRDVINFLGETFKFQA